MTKLPSLDKLVKAAKFSETNNVGLIIKGLVDPKDGVPRINKYVCGKKHVYCRMTRAHIPKNDLDLGRNFELITFNNEKDYEGIQYLKISGEEMRLLSARNYDGKTGPWNFSEYGSVLQGEKVIKKLVRRL